MWRQTRPYRAEVWRDWAIRSCWVVRKLCLPCPQPVALGTLSGFHCKGSEMGLKLEPAPWLRVSQQSLGANWMGHGPPTAPRRTAGPAKPSWQPSSCLQHPHHTPHTPSTHNLLLARHKPAPVARPKTLSGRLHCGDIGFWERADPCAPLLASGSGMWCRQAEVNPSAGAGV